MTVQVNLNLGGTSHSQVLIDADTYTASMLGTNPYPVNNYFTAADIVVVITEVQTAATDFRAALNAPTSDTKNDTIKAKRKTIDAFLTILGGKVEAVANHPSITDPAIKLAIVHSAGMNEKTAGHPQRHVFDATEGSIPQTVYLTAQGMVNAHEWKYSADPVNFTNQIPLDATTAASQTTPVLAKQEFAFWHRPVTPTGPHPWEGPKLFTVV